MHWKNYISLKVSGHWKNYSRLNINNSRFFRLSRYNCHCVFLTNNFLGSSQQQLVLSIPPSWLAWIITSWTNRVIQRWKFHAMRGYPLTRLSQSRILLGRNEISILLMVKKLPNIGWFWCLIFFASPSITFKTILWWR